MECQEDIGIRIVTAELLNDGIVVKFKDGRCFLYSASLLAQIIPRAQELDEAATTW